MVTEEEFLKAINIVQQYQVQIRDQISQVIQPVEVSMITKLTQKINDMDLPVRTLNAMKAARVETLGDLVSYERSDIRRFRLVGKRTVSELNDLVYNQGLKFGMDIEKYGLKRTQIS